MLFEVGMKEDFGDFREIREDIKGEQQEISVRVRMPRHRQFAGIVIQRLGGNRMSVKTRDNKIRNCRVPGRFSRRFWLRPGDAVIIEPWPDDDSKADIVHQYRKNEVNQLKKHGFLSGIETGF